MAHLKHISMFVKRYHEIEQLIGDDERCMSYDQVLVVDTIIYHQVIFPTRP